jgi:hypothetical protein
LERRIGFRRQLPPPPQLPPQLNPRMQWQLKNVIASNSGFRAVRRHADFTSVKQLKGDAFF